MENRNKLIKYGLVGLVLASAAGLSVRTNNSIHKEKEVEKKVEQAYGHRQLVLEDLEKVSKEDLVYKVNDVEFSTYIDSAKEDIMETGKFISKFSRYGIADDLVTSKNYKDVNLKMQGIEERLDAAERKVEYAKRISEVDNINREMDYINETIMNKEGLPIIFLKEVQEKYNQGLKCVEERFVPEARICLRDLENLKQEAGDLLSFQSQIEGQYEKIRKNAEDECVLETIEPLYFNAKFAFDRAKVNELKDSFEQLKEVNRRLSAEYEIRILNDSRNKGYFSRDYENGKKETQYFVRIGGINSRGFLVPNTSREVRISEESYRKIEDDGKDGKIDYDIFGEKKAGYLNEEFFFE